MTDARKFIRDDISVEKVSDPILDNLTKEEKLTNTIVDSLIDLNRKYIEPPIYLGIADEGYISSVKRICTPGNISAVIGKAKAKKSFVQSMFVAATVLNSDINRRIVANLPEDKRNIIVFDTEQSEWDVYRVARRIKAMTSGEVDNLAVLTLRGKDAKEIKEIIEQTHNIIGNVGMMFIDQVADLARSINSEEEAVEIVKWLEKFSAEHDLHICCILHQNKSDNNATGWLGSQIMKKAESIISVEKDAQNKDISHIKPSYSRSMDFEEFSIMINGDGIPVILTKGQLLDMDINIEPNF